MNSIEKYINEGRYDDAVDYCIENNLNNLGKIILISVNNTKNKNKISNVKEKLKIFNTNIIGIEKENKNIEEKLIL